MLVRRQYVSVRVSRSFKQLRRDANLIIPSRKLCVFLKLINAYRALSDEIDESGVSDSE